MTRDEILALPPGDELDNLVAEKVMGWHIETDDGSWKRWVDEDGHYTAGINKHDGWYEDDEDFHLLHWHPSGSILWAWEIAEKDIFTHFSIDYDFYRSNNNEKNKWRAEISNTLGSDVAYADDPAVAICRAALLLFVEE